LFSALDIASNLLNLSSPRKYKRFGFWLQFKRRLTA
jgi:hypothetical protein